MKTNTAGRSIVIAAYESDFRWNVLRNQAAALFLYEKRVTTKKEFSKFGVEWLRKKNVKEKRDKRNEDLARCHLTSLTVYELR